MNSSNFTEHEYQNKEMNLYYTICEVLVAIFAVVGNALVIYVFRKERRLRRRTNYYIVSLAAADFLVGLLGIPFAIMSSVGLPSNLHACLFTVSLLVVLCTISIFCLVAVSVDRYWAILHPMGYSRNVRTKTAIVIISVCWVTGSMVGLLPLMGWHKEAPLDGRCFFLDVMDYNYLVFLYFGTIITPALLLAAFYTHIYQVVLKQLRQTVTMNPGNSSTASGPSTGGTMLRMLGAAQKREVKATQNLAIIVSFFMICWIPLYTINCILAFCRECKVNSTFMLFCIILSHLNSAINPLLYAYHLRDFRSALKNLLWTLFGCDDHRMTQGQHTTRTLLAASNNCNYRQANNGRQFLESTPCAKPYWQSQMNYKQKCLKHATISMENSPELASAVVDREIWNIPEASSSASSDSFGQLEEGPSHDRTSIVRPATPYRPRNINDMISSQTNAAYIKTSSLEEESADVFMEDTFISCEYGLIDNELDNLANVGNEMKRSEPTTLSTSSPQLQSRGLFLVEGEFKRPKFVRSWSLVEKQLQNELKTNHKLHRQFQIVGDIFKVKRALGRSLSDEGTASNDRMTVTKPNNGKVVRTSCGS